MLLAPREKRFLEKNAIRLNVTSKESMKWLGQTIGNLVAVSFKKKFPVKAVCLYGVYGAGKSFLANEILHGLINSKDCTIESRTRFNVFSDTFPKCRHIDWWMWKINAFARTILPEYRRPVLAEDEFLIGEWCSEIPEKWLEKNRVDIEISCGSTLEWAIKRKFVPVQSIEEITRNNPPPQYKSRVASIAGFGNGEWLIEALLKAQKTTNN